MAKQDATGLRYDYPLWAPVAQSILLFLFDGGLPWGLSKLSYRSGWSGGRLGFWNLAPLILVIGGVGLIIWVAALHIGKVLQHGWRIQRTPWEPPGYLVVSGPYRHSRNPLYVGHLAIWLGWSLFYGSVAVTLGTGALWATLAIVIVPYEERRLAEELGEPYLHYQKRVSRWFGKISE